MLFDALYRDLRAERSFAARPRRQRRKARQLGEK